MGYAGKSVLVAADNRDMRMMLTEMVRELNFSRIDQAISAAQAISFASNLRYECVLIDLTTVGELSLATVRSIRTAQGEKAGILVLAGRNTEENVRHAEAAGADGLIAKPFSTANFAALIDRVTQRPPAPQTTQRAAPAPAPANTDDDVYI